MLINDSKISQAISSDKKINFELMLNALLSKSLDKNRIISDILIFNIMQRYIHKNENRAGELH